MIADAAPPVKSWRDIKYHLWYNLFMEIEFNLDVILKRKKIGLREAARICDLPYSSIQRIAANKNNQLSLRTIEKLCNGLNIKWADLFREKVK